ncbi:Transposase for insertion sequence element IS801 (plasmid) [Pseudomonas syringae pv. avii]|uniref:Transposase for insertion sequence element IS801 n=1 Tax=Pseudomonas syringae pv. avii TaxID=663959 RepID=A0ABY1UFY9_PSESX|nr:Transposase for insertion sequence element IS801 [Pseudomonas syringae pv. avii]
MSIARNVKYLCNTCHCRACPSCGKKATDQWIAVQNNRLPDCPWQHLVFTLPDTLWSLFFYNRWLLDALFRLAADNLIYTAKRRGLRVGIFGALHTYGRRLNWHPHVHLSVTAGGLDEQGVWKNLSFHKEAPAAALDVAGARLPAGTAAFATDDAAAAGPHPL